LRALCCGRGGKKGRKVRKKKKRRRKKKEGKCEGNDREKEIRRKRAEIRDRLSTQPLNPGYATDLGKLMSQVGLLPANAYVQVTGAVMTMN